MATPPPAAATLAPNRLDQARRLRDQLRDSFGWLIQPNAEGTGFHLAGSASRANHRANGNEIDETHRARLTDLKPELLAITLGGPAVALGDRPPPVPRDGNYPLDLAEELLRQPDAPDLGGRLMLLLCGRWRDRPNAETRQMIDRALRLLTRDRLSWLIRQADTKDNPARWFARSVSRDLADVMRRPRAPAMASLSA